MVHHFVHCQVTLPTLVKQIDLPTMTLLLQRKTVMERYMYIYWMFRYSVCVYLLHIFKVYRSVWCFDALCYRLDHIHQTGIDYLIISSRRSYPRDSFRKHCGRDFALMRKIKAVHLVLYEIFMLQKSALTFYPRPARICFPKYMLCWYS